jgi:sn-glycerol 3-phosphate transport system substrate-binding protein
MHQLAIRGLSLLAAATTMAAAIPAWAQTEIQFWHAMAGVIGDAMQEQVNEFNASQKDYKVVAVYKGGFNDTLTAAISAYRARRNVQPHLVMVYEVGTGLMMASNAIYPAYKLMEDHGAPLDTSKYLQSVARYYSDKEGRLLAFPFNSSTPLLYWNKEKFRKAGLDPDVGPKTWDEMGAFAKKLVDAGEGCAFTPSYSPWTMLEEYSAWHNVPFATQRNGMNGFDAQLVFNGPAQLAHIARLEQWAKDKRFTYTGRESKPTTVFAGGGCAMHICSSASTGSILKGLGADNVGMSLMPYDDKFVQHPQNSIVGGASLWIFQGKPKEEYKGVAAYLSYLAKPEVQSKFQRKTGYVPLTKAASEITEKSGFYKTNPGFLLPAQSLELNPPTDNSAGLRLGNFVQLRAVMDEELESVFAGTKDAKSALDSAVTRGNKLLRDFQASMK